MKINRVHIGEIIRQLVDERKMSKASFAQSLNIQRQNIDKTVFSKNSIDTDLLCRISEVLDCNLFKYYTDDKISNINGLQELKATLTIVMGAEKQDQTFRFVFGQNNVEMKLK